MDEHDSLVSIVEAWEHFRNQNPDRSLSEFAAQYPENRHRQIHQFVRGIAAFDELMERPNPKTLPTVVDKAKLELEATLGQGGMGIVRLARQPELDRTVAVKFFDPRLGEAALARFRQEALAIASLNHPNIIEVFDHCFDAPSPYIVMELAEKRSLKEHYASTSKPHSQAEIAPAEIAQLVLKVANAVHFAHQKGIIHRDLKPSNILICSRGEPKVADFGLAKLSSSDLELTQRGIAIGTPGYMAPEQERAEEAHTSNDVFGIGGILWWCLTGESPRPSAPSQQEYDRPRRSDTRKTLHRDLETIAITCLRPDPKDRYGSADAVAQDLELFLAGRPIRARRVSVMERAVKFCARNPIRSALSAAMACLTLFIVFAWERSNRRVELLGRVDSLLISSPSHAPRLIEELEPLPPLAAAKLESLLASAHSDSEPSDSERARAILALKQFDSAWLHEYVLSAEPLEVSMVVSVLRRHDASVGDFGPELFDPINGQRLIRAAVACSMLTPKQFGQLIESDTNDNLLRALVSELDVSGPVAKVVWLRGLRPVRDSLQPRLSTMFCERGSPIVCEILVGLYNDEEFLRGGVGENGTAGETALLETVLKAPTPNALRRVFPIIQSLADQHRESLIERLRRVASEEAATEKGMPKLCANAAVALYRLGEPKEVVQLLRSAPDPGLRSYVIASVPKSGCDPELLLDELKGRKVLETPIVQGILLALGGFEKRHLTESQRSTLKEQLIEISQQSPNTGVQSAARWVARAQGLEDAIVESTQRQSTNNRLIGANGHTLVLVRPAIFQMGARPADFEDEQDERLHWRQVNHAFAIATHEVTAGQFRRMRADYGNRWALTEEHPACIINYFSAAEYCNWLSRLENIPESEWCYRPNADGHYHVEMVLVAGALEKTGYRLPTEAEWELACRAGAETKYSFGQSSELLPEYGVTVETNASRPLPVGCLKPNLFGLFDMHGNVWEWCLEPYARDYPFGSRNNPATIRQEEIILRAETNGVLRGGGSDRLPKQARSTHRWTVAFGRNPETAGFRVVRTVKGPYTPGM